MKKVRAMFAIGNKIGKHLSDQFVDSWNKLKNRRTRREVCAEEDGIINFFFDLGFSKLQVGSLLTVGGPCLNRILEERRNPFKVKKQKGPPKQFTSDQNIFRIVSFILAKEIYSPLYVVGEVQGEHLESNPCKYEVECKKKNVRIMSTNRYSTSSSTFLALILARTRPIFAMSTW